MDVKIVMAAFWTIFLAELGDKTQLATLAFSAGSQSKLSVFLGSAGALVLTSALAVLLGDALSRLLPIRVVHMVAAVGFVVIGLVMLWGELGKTGAH